MEREKGTGDAISDRESVAFIERKREQAKSDAGCKRTVHKRVVKLGRQADLEGTGTAATGITENVSGAPQA